MANQTWQIQIKRKVKKSQIIKFSLAIISTTCIAATLYMFKERDFYDTPEFRSALNISSNSKSKENLIESSLQSPQEYERAVQDKQEKIKEVRITTFEVLNNLVTFP